MAKDLHHWVACRDCGTKLPPGSARIVVGGRIICADCAYAAQHGAPRQGGKA